MSDSSCLEGVRFRGRSDSGNWAALKSPMMVVLYPRSRLSATFFLSQVERAFIVSNHGPFRAAFGPDTAYTMNSTIGVGSFNLV